MAELEFHPAARAEAVAASEYLESERIGYGVLFEDELDHLLERIGTFPKSGRRLQGYSPELDVRAYPMATFRYSVVVAIMDGQPIVYAIAHHHRKPGYWQSRLRG
jgi:toxin ParE1/3/4